MELKGKTFIVTGGASGLGRATARRLAADGANVVIADVNEEIGRQAASDVGMTFIKTDVTSEASVQQMVESARHTFGDIHGLVNCAGLGVAQKVLGKSGLHSLESFTRVLQVNLIGTFNAIRLVAEQMCKQAVFLDGERGVIVNTASVASFDGQIGQAAYSASKGGVAAMTLPIARELASHGIRVMTIAPGIFDTPMLGQLSEAARASLGAQVPFPQRLGCPSEYADLVAHIVTNRMLNGEVIRLDGGLRMAPK